MDSNILSTREIRRYQPQIQLESFGLQGQEILKQAKILVVGAGGVGNATLKNLVTAGVGYIGICDDSLIKEEDFCWQNVYGDNDIGKQKAIVSKQHLQSRNSFTNIKVHNIRLTDETLKIVIDNYDLIIDTTNDIETNLLLAEVFEKYNKHYIYGSIINNKAVAFVLKKVSRQTIKTLFENLPKIDPGPPDTFTPLVVVNSMAGCILATEAVKTLILTETPPSHHKIIILNVSDYSVNFYDFN